MSKNTLVSLVVIALVVVGLVIFGRSGTAPQSATGMINNGPAGAVGAGGAISADHMSYDFGTISMAAGKVRHLFPITNSGASPVALKQIYTSCMCTSARMMLNGKTFGPYGMPGHGMMEQMNQMMQPGEEGEVEAEFDPAAHGPAGIGPVDRTIYLETNDGKTVELKFTAVVTP